MTGNGRGDIDGKCPGGLHRRANRRLLDGPGREHGQNGLATDEYVRSEDEKEPQLCRRDACRGIYIQL